MPVEVEEDGRTPLSGDWADDESVARKENTRSNNVLGNEDMIVLRTDLTALGAVDVRGGAVEDFGGIHDRFRERGMWMNRHRDIAGERGHFDSEHAFRDQFAGADADDADSEHALGLRID